MAEAFDPYHLWLGIPPDEQPPNHYRLLGIKLLERNADVISSAADRQMAHVRSFQSGKHGVESQKLLNDLSAARICLLSAEKKAIYDRALQAQLSKQAVAAAPPPAAPPAAPPPPTAAARPLRVAQPVAAIRPAALPRQTPVTSQASAPADPLGFDPLAEDSTPRHRKRKRSTQQPAVLAGIAAGLVAVVGLFLGIAGSGRNEPQSSPPKIATAKTASDSADRNEPPQKTPERKIAPKIESSDDEPQSTPGARAQDDALMDSESDTGDDELPESDASSRPTDEMPDAESDATMPADAAPAREAVPDADAVKTATADIHALLKEDFSTAKKRDQRSALAEKLFALAQDSSVPPERYALLSEAKRLAIGAADPGLAMQALTALTEQFDLNRFELAADMIEGFGEKDLAPTAREALVEVLTPLVDEAAASGQFKVARRLATSGLAVARKGNLNDAAKGLARQAQELAAKEKLADAADAARKQLEAKPDDADAHLTLGKYLCFVDGDWSGGLPHLAAGSDAELRKPAERELAGVSSPPEQVEVGDLWWDLAESTKGPDKDLLRARAGYWYQQAVDELKGLAKAKIDKRLAELSESQPSKIATKRRKATYLTDLPATEVRVYPAFDQKISLQGVAPLHSILLHPLSNSFSHAAFNLAGRYTSLAGRAALNDSTDPRTHTPLTFRIVGDGKQLWKSRAMQNRADFQEFDVSVEGVRKLELFVDCPGFDGMAHAIWFEPQLSKDKLKAASEPASTKVIASGKWIDLLPLADPAKQHLEAAWRRTPDGLRVDKPFKPIELPAGIGGDYTLHVEFTRLFGRESVAIFLPALSQQCMLGMSVSNGELSGLEIINGQYFSASPSTIRPGTLENGHRYSLDVTVRQRGTQMSIESKLDDKPFVHWSGDVSSLSLWRDWSVPHPDMIALAANEPTVFHVAKLKMLSGKATVEKDSGPPAPLKSGSDSGTSVKKTPETEGADPQGRATKPTRGKTQFLADLPPHDVHSLHTGDPPPLSIHEIPSPHGIFLHPADRSSAHTAFDLSGRFESLTGLVGINDTALEGAAGPLIFRIVGDGKELWKSRPLQKRADSQEFKVSVADVRELELIVDAVGGARYGHAVWIEPQLTLAPKNSRSKNAGAPPSGAAQDKAATAKLLKDAVLIATFDDATVLRKKGEVQLRDLSGKQQPGLVVGATLAPGKAGAALHLQGIGQHVDWGADASLSPPNLTACAWIKPTSGGQLYTDILSKTGVEPGLSGFVVRLQAGLPELGLGVGDGRWHVMHAPAVVPADQWSHVAATHDAKTNTLYVNGRPTLALPSDGSPGVSPQRCFIGSSVGQDETQFFGLIDEVALFDRALSADEIRQIYQLGVDGKSLAVSGKK